MAKTKVHGFINQDTDEIYRVCAECRDEILGDPDDVHNQEPWEELDHVPEDSDYEECEMCGDEFTESEDPEAEDD